MCLKGSFNFFIEYKRGTNNPVVISLTYTIVPVLLRTNLSSIPVSRVVCRSQSPVSVQCFPVYSLFSSQIEGKKPLKYYFKKSFVFY